MKNKLLRMISILILATLLLAPGLDVGAARRVTSPAVSQATGAPAFGVTTRVSVASDGSQANGDSWMPSISADGHYVAFQSEASNLVSGDTNLWMDIFVHDRQKFITERVSITTNGRQGNERSFEPSISADGRYVAFGSSASNLVGGDTNGSSDIFVRDRQISRVRRVSITSDGS